MKGLTRRQREILDFIEGYIQKNQYSPSYREIMGHFGFTSLGSVYKHINVLKRKGVLTSEPNTARSVCLVNEATVTGSRHRVEIPFLGYIAAGEPIQAFPQAEQVGVPSELVLHASKTFALRVRGDSMMEDGILDGDLIVIEAASRVRPGSTVVAMIDGHEVTLKKYYPEGQYVRLEPANVNFDPIIVDAKQVAVQGFLRGLVRSYAN